MRVGVLTNAFVCMGKRDRETEKIRRKKLRETLRDRIAFSIVFVYQKPMGVENVWHEFNTA